MGAGYGMPPQGWGGGGWPQQAMPYGGLPPVAGGEQWEPDISGLNMRPAAGHAEQWAAQASEPMRAHLSRTIESAKHSTIRGKNVWREIKYRGQRLRQGNLSVSAPGGWQPGVSGLSLEEESAQGGGGRVGGRGGKRGRGGRGGKRAS
jgi:hypothetical protein